MADYYRWQMQDPAEVYARKQAAEKRGKKIKQPVTCDGCIYQLGGWDKKRCLMERKEFPGGCGIKVMKGGVK